MHSPRRSASELIRRASDQVGSQAGKSPADQVAGAVADAQRAISTSAAADGPVRAEAARAASS